DDHLRTCREDVHYGDAIRRVSLRHEQLSLSRVQPGQEEWRRQPFDDRLARAAAQLKAADAAAIRPGGLLTDVGVLQIGAQSDANSVLQTRQYGGLGARGQIDLPQVSGRRVLHDICGVVRLVEKHLLGRSHSRTNYSGGRAIRAGQLDLDEIPAAFRHI